MSSQANNVPFSSSGVLVAIASPVFVEMATVWVVEAMGMQRPDRLIKGGGIVPLSVPVF